MASFLHYAERRLGEVLQEVIDHEGGRPVEETVDTVDCFSLKDVFKMEQNTLRQWEDAINDIKPFRAWDKIPEGKPYGSLDALLKAELGVESEAAGMETIRQRAMREAAESRSRSDLGVHNAHAKEQKRDASGMFTADDDINCGSSESTGGTKTRYLADRLRAQRPDIFEKMAHGEYPSVHAAARDAGIVKEKTPAGAHANHLRGSAPPLRNTTADKPSCGIFGDRT